MATLYQIPKNLTAALDSMEKRIEDLEEGGGGGPSIQVEPLTLYGNGVTTALEGHAYSPVTVSVPDGYGNTIAVSKTNLAISNPFITNSDPTGLELYNKIIAWGTGGINENCDAWLYIDASAIQAGTATAKVTNSASTGIYTDAYDRDSGLMAIVHYSSDGESIQLDELKMVAVDLSGGTCTVTDLMQYASLIKGSITARYHKAENIPYPD